MRKLFSILVIACLTTLCLATIKLYAEETPATDFYVYTDKNSASNHFIPSGWMGDHGDLKFNDQATDESYSGTTSMKITYTAKKSKGQGWAGIYWQSAQNNWGDKDTGFDLSDYNKLSFMAKGVEGGEILTQVKVGGIIKNVITGEDVAFPDTVTAESEPIRLTDQWQEYYVNLNDKDLSNVNGGLCLIFNADQAGGEQTVYLDEIRYVYDPELKKDKKTVNLPFYVYADSGSLDNHFIPSGWMPDSRTALDLKINQNSKDFPYSGESCIKIEYKNASGTRWAGIYWQYPANNWGTVPNAGYNLQGSQKLTFWARGEKGEEVINEFKMGGLSGGEHMDSDSASTMPIQLTKEWKKYEIDLTGRDLSYIIGGFAWATNIDVNNPEGIVFYIDEIRYEASEELIQ